MCLCVNVAVCKVVLVNVHRRGLELKHLSSRQLLLTGPECDEDVT
jgi:hypothetical protein